MKPTVVNLFKAAGFAAFLALSACGGGGGDGSPAAGGGGGGTVTGAAAKGIVKNGIVTVKDANGQVIGTGRTNTTDGSYSVNVGDYAGPVFVEISADSMTTIQDEITGDDEPATNVSGVLLESVSNITAGQAVDVNVSPLTTLVAQLAKNSAGGAEITPALVQQAQAAITTTLGFNPIATKPLNPSDPATANADAASKKQAILLAGLAQFGSDNPTCAALGDRAAQLACASSQLAMAYSGSTISNEQATIVIDGSALTGLTEAIAMVSMDPAINQTGATVDPESDPATNSLAQAEMNPETPQQQTVATPTPNNSDIVAVRELLNNLRSNAAALENESLNGPVETQLADFADSLPAQATGLEFGAFQIAEATSLAIEMYARYKFQASMFPSLQRIVDQSRFGSARCLVLNAVQRQPNMPVTGVTIANTNGADNANFAACTVFGETLQFNGVNYQARHYLLLTPINGTNNTFNVESDSRVCRNQTPGATDTCLSLANGTVVNGVAGSNVATTMGTQTFANGRLSRITGDFDGQVVPPFELQVINNQVQGVELADTATFTISFVSNNPTETSSDISGSGEFVSVLDGNTLTSTVNSFVINGVENEEGEAIGTISADVSVRTSLGQFSGMFESNSDDTGMASIDLNGAVSLINGETESQLFEGAIILTTSPGNEQAAPSESVAFTGTVSLPQRPVLSIELLLTSVSETLEQPASNLLNFTYQQNGITVILDGEEQGGVESLTIVSPTSLVSIGPFDPTGNGTVDILRDGRLAGRYNLSTARIDYVDGTFEQF
ncbi:MAG: hypothetical protein AB1516_13530 [Pseudomonadota bacterium]